MAVNTTDLYYYYCYYYAFVVRKRVSTNVAHLQATNITNGTVHSGVIRF